MTFEHPFITGGAGFIGSHLVDELVARGCEVTVYDNFSVGSRQFLEKASDSGRLKIIEGDLLDLELLTQAVGGHDIVFHLSANPEARWGIENTRLDLEQETIATYNCLEAMRRQDVSRIALASSGTVYGDSPDPMVEDCIPSLPISLYGAGKLASEALVSAFCGTFDFQAWIFRFSNIIGPRGTHGAMVDFFKKLTADPTTLQILGDGTQAKPYIHVKDLMAAILFILGSTDEQVNIFNIGTGSVTTVTEIAEMVIEEFGLANVRLEYTGGDRGWPGDVPQSRFNTTKLERLGWTSPRPSNEAVRKSAQELAEEIRLGEASWQCKS